MNDTWWVGEDDLDVHQTKVITLPIDGNHLVVGPPGSGKTNLLLLRANYLYLAGHKNILIIIFTRTLQDFVASGGEQYSFPVSKIQTCRRWQMEFLREYGESFETEGGFEKQRAYFLERVKTLVEEQGLRDAYDAILLDEAQDYLPEELETFGRLSERLFCVADSRQKIYQGDNPFDTLQSLCGEPHPLKFHYRNGLQVCKLADGIAKETKEFELLTATSNYNEDANPSSVEHLSCRDVDEQGAEILKRLDAQLKAYPDELIGVVAPKREDVDRIWAIVLGSEFADKAALLVGRDRDSFIEDKPICICTFHAVKGLEVRCLHMACCETLRKFPHNRNMTYTAVTRAKTSLSLYYGGEILGYLEAALAALEPPPELPPLRDVFGGGS